MSKKASVQLQVGTFFKVLPKYTRLLRWLTVDSIWRFRGKVSLIIVSGLLYVSLQIQALGLAIYYAHSVEKGIVFTLFGKEFGARTSPELLSICGLGVLVCLLLSASLGYFSRTRVLKLWRIYEEFCSKRIFLLANSNLRIWSPFNQDYGDEIAILRLARSDSRYCGRILGILLYTLIPTLTVLVAIAALLYINLPLTLFLIGLMGISTGFLYKTTISGVQHTISLQKYSKPFTLEYRRILQSLKSISLPHSEIKYWLEEKAFQSRDIKRYQDAFEGRLRVIAESQFIGNIFFAVAISGILLTLGTSILLQGKGWSQLLIYLVASRQGLLSFKDISQKITSINRFYPYLRRYFQFLENMEPDVRINPQPAMSYRVTVNLSPIAGSLSYWNLLTGNRLGLVSPIELNRYTLASLIDCLLGEPSKVARKTLNSIWFVTANYTVLPEYPFRKSLGLPVGYTYQKFCKEMKGTGLEEKVRQQLPRNLEKCLSRSKWTQVEPDVKFAVALLAASHSNAQWIILDEVGLQFLSDVAQQYLLERLAKKITVVVFTTTLTNVGKYKEDAIALLNQNELIGLGSVEWFTGNKEKIETILNQSAKKTSKSRSTDSYLGEDEDDLFEE